MSAAWSKYYEPEGDVVRHRSRGSCGLQSSSTHQEGDAGRHFELTSDVLVTESSELCTGLDGGNPCECCITWTIRATCSGCPSTTSCPRKCQRASPCRSTSGRTSCSRFSSATSTTQGRTARNTTGRQRSGRTPPAWSGG